LGRVFWGKKPHKSRCIKARGEPPTKKLFRLKNQTGREPKTAWDESVGGVGV